MKTKLGKKILDYFYMLLMMVGAIMILPGLIAWKMNEAGRSLFLLLIGAILMAVATAGSRSLKKLGNKQNQEKEGFLGKPGTSKRKLNIGCLIIILSMLALAIFIRSMELWI